jgi:hypothetical protein
MNNTKNIVSNIIDHRNPSAISNEYRAKGAINPENRENPGCDTIDTGFKRLNLPLLIFDLIFLPVHIIRMVLIYFWGSKYNLKGFQFLDVIMHADRPYFNQEDCRMIDTIGKDYRIVVREDSRIFPFDLNRYFDVKFAELTPNAKDNPFNRDYDRNTGSNGSSTTKLSSTESGYSRSRTDKIGDLTNKVIIGTTKNKLYAWEIDSEEIDDMDDDTERVNAKTVKAADKSPVTQNKTEPKDDSDEKNKVNKTTETSHIKDKKMFMKKKEDTEEDVEEIDENTETTNDDEDRDSYSSDDSDSSGESTQDTDTGTADTDELDENEDSDDVKNPIKMRRKISHKSKDRDAKHNNNKNRGKDSHRDRPIKAVEGVNYFSSGEDKNKKRHTNSKNDILHSIRDELNSAFEN